MKQLTYDEIRDMLPTNKHRLDDELEVYAQVLEQITSVVAHRNLRMIREKDALARAEARIADDYSASGEKMTVDVRAGRVIRDPERLKAFDRYQDARDDYERWQGLQEAWRSKGFNMRDLGALYANQYFAVNSAGGDRPRRRETAETYERPVTRTRTRASL